MDKVFDIDPELEKLPILNFHAMESKYMCLVALSVNEVTQNSSSR